MQLGNLILNAPVRNINARVEHYSGSTLAATYNYNDKLKNLTVDRAGVNNKFFGYGVCQKLNVKLIDKDRAVNIAAGDTLKIYFTNNNVTVKPFPVFKVTEVNRDENTNELSIRSLWIY